MFDSIAEISKNKYINSLDKAAEKFGLAGVYMEYEKDTISMYSGIYFVFGRDKEKIYSGEVDIRTLAEKGRALGTMYDSSVMYYKLTDCHPFAAHQAIIEQCQHAEFIETLYTEYGRGPAPMAMTYMGLRDAKMLYSNAHNPNIDATARGFYEQALMNVFEYEESWRNPKHKDYKKNMYMETCHYDTTRGKLYNWFKKHFVKYKNKVSLEHLLYTSLSVYRVTIPMRDSKELIKALRKRPDILYWRSKKPSGKAYKFPAGQGYGPTKEDNDTRMIEFAFNSAYSDDINEILDRISFPQGMAIAPEAMIKKAKQVCTLVLPPASYDNFRNLCIANNVPFCIDDKFQSQKGDNLNILVPYEHREMVDAMLSRLSEEKEAFHLRLPKVQEQTRIYAKDDSLMQVDLRKLQASLGKSQRPSSPTSLDAIINSLSSAEHNTVEGIPSSVDLIDYYK